MLARPFLVSFLLVGGGLLAVFGLILWWALPIRLAFPPYLVTALLALAYGGYEARERRARREKPPDKEK